MSISIEGMNETSDFEASLERLKDVEPQDNWTEEDWKHFKTIKLALKKQIPKKPKSYVKTGDYFDYECPQCRMTYGRVTWRVKYCPNCGQAICFDDGERKGNG